MKKINSKGFSIKEFMLMLAVLAILFAVGAKLALDSTKNNYSSFKTLSNKFADAVAKYKDQVMPKNEYYLFEVEKKGFIGELVNPLNKNEVCDKYESFVEIPEINKKKITLVCGSYVVEGVQNDYYKVYEVTPWSKEKTEEDNDSTTLYNFKLNKNEMLKEYVPLRTFIQKYYDQTGELITDVSDLKKKKNVEVLSYEAYRKKELVKEIK